MPDSAGNFTVQDYIDSGRDATQAKALYAADVSDRAESAAKAAAYDKAQKASATPPNKATTDNAQSLKDGEKAEVGKQGDVAGQERKSDAQKANNGGGVKEDPPSKADPDGGSKESTTGDPPAGGGNSTTGPRNAMLRDVLFISEDNHLEVKTSSHFIFNGMLQQSKVDESFSGPIDFNTKEKAIACQGGGAGSGWSGSLHRSCQWFPGKMLFYKTGFQDEDPAEACMCVDNNKQVTYRDKDNNEKTVEGVIKQATGGIVVSHVAGGETFIPDGKQTGDPKDVKPTVKTVDITRKFPVHGWWFPAVESPTYHFTPLGPPPDFDGDEPEDGDETGDNPEEDKVIKKDKLDIDIDHENDNSSAASGEGDGASNATVGNPVNCATSPKQSTAAVPDPGAGGKTPGPCAGAGDLGGGRTANSDQTPIGFVAAGFFSRDAPGGPGGGAGASGGGGSSPFQLGVDNALAAVVVAENAVAAANAAFAEAEKSGSTKDQLRRFGEILDANKQLEAAKKAAADATALSGNTVDGLTVVGGHVSTVQGSGDSPFQNFSPGVFNIPKDPVDIRTDVEKAQVAVNSATLSYAAAVAQSGSASSSASLLAAGVKTEADRQLLLAGQREQFAAQSVVDENRDRVLKRIKEVDDEIRRIKASVPGSSLVVRDGLGGSSTLVIQNNSGALVDDRNFALSRLRVKLKDISYKQNQIQTEPLRTVLRIHEGVAIRAKVNDQSNTSGPSSNSFIGFPQTIKRMIENKVVNPADIDIARIAFGEHNVYYQTLIMQKKNIELAAESDSVAQTQVIESFDSLGGWTCTTSIQSVTTAGAVEGTGVFRGTYT